MNDAIFLSAGVPDPLRGPEYAATADTVAITSAVSALVYVTLGRRLLVWGGHPAITPMVRVVAEALGVEYGDWVKLYQTRHFEADFPEDNARFKNVTLSDDVDGDRQKSLLAMRERMFSEHSFRAAVFIGGMGGIVEEFELFQKLQPQARTIPVVSTGGATLKLVEKMPVTCPDLSDDMDYVALFHRHLDISIKELRYPSPENQPEVLDQRLWHPSKSKST